MIAGVSWANLLYLDIWRLLALRNTPSAYYLDFAWYDYVAAILAVVGGGAVLGYIAAKVQTKSARFRRPFEFAFLASVVILADSVRKYESILLPQVLRDIGPALHLLGRVGIAILLIAICALVWRYSAFLARLYRRVLLVLSPFALFTVGRAVVMMTADKFADFRDVASHVPRNGPVASRRVVLIVFDELDQELAFERRPPDLRLPNFDRLRAQSVTFDSAFPPAANTAESLPSYLLGAAVARVEPNSPRSFTAVLTDSQRVRSDTAPTLISKAAARGVRTALSGFYIPYCRLRFAADLVGCYWEPMVNGGSINSHRDNVLESMIQQVSSLYPFYNRVVHIRRIKNVVSHGEEFAADPSIQFVFIHLPVPHLPPVYDRRSSSYRTTVVSLSGYIDNLALADRLLGDIRARMEARGLWDRSTIIVTSDHPWRNKRDYAPALVGRRVPLMVKLAGQTQAARSTASVNSLIVHDLALALAGGHCRIDLGTFTARSDQQHVVADSSTRLRDVAACE